MPIKIIVFTRFFVYVLPVLFLPVIFTRFMKTVFYFHVYYLFVPLTVMVCASSATPGLATKQ